MMLWASTLVDALVAGLVLLRPWQGQGPDRPGPVIGLPGVLVAVLVTSVVFIGKWMLLQRWGLHLFGLIHLVYLDLVVVLPVAGVAVLLAGRRGRDSAPWRRVTGSVRVIAWACLVPAPLGIYATYIEPFRLQLETARVTVPPERAGAGTIRIGVLSDIQTGRVTDYERSAVERLMALAPDVIVLPGDFFQGPQEAFERELPALRDLLSRLSAPGGVYFVLGDVDRPERMERLFADTQVRLLNNEVVRVRVGDRRLTIGGVELAYRLDGPQRVIAELESAPGAGDVRILLSHRPDPVLDLPAASRIDLVLAGHTHGGQVQVPFYGPPFFASNVPRQVGAGGYHKLGGRRVYVSRGIGCERGQAPRIRFGAPPEISLLMLGDL